MLTLYTRSCKEDYKVIIAVLQTHHVRLLSAVLETHRYAMTLSWHSCHELRYDQIIHWQQRYFNRKPIEVSY